MRTAPQSLKLDTDNTGNLPWIPDFIVINNPGNRWVWLPQIKKWVPPTYMNAVYPWGVSPGTYEIVIGAAVGSDGQSGTPTGVTPGTGSTAVPAIEFVVQEALNPNPGTPYGVTINAGTVNLAAGTSVSVTGTPTVNLSAGTSVSISGTPTVTISGNVTFSNTQIAVLNVSGNLLNVQQIPTYLGSFAAAAGYNVVSSAVFTVPAGTHALSIVVTQTDTILQIISNTTGISYSRIFGIQSHDQNVIVPINTALDTSYAIRVTNQTSVAGTVYVSAVLSTEAVVVKTDNNEPIRIATRRDAYWSTYRGNADNIVANTWVLLLGAGPGNAEAISQIQLGFYNGSGAVQRLVVAIFQDTGLGPNHNIAEVLLANGTHENIVYNYTHEMFWPTLWPNPSPSQPRMALYCYANAAGCYFSAAIQSHAI